MNSTLQKILAIDDAPSIHSLLKVRLREEPVELHSAVDGESGFFKCFG